MNVIRQEIRTGLLVVFSLAVLVSIVLYLGAPGVFVPQKTYYIYVENAAGIRPGADVALAGRKVGQVVELVSPVPMAARTMSPKTETRIEVRVNRSANIYRDVKVRLTSNGLLGEMFIDFASGVPSSGEAENGYSFLGNKDPGLSEIAPIFLERLEPIMKEATTTFETLQVTANNISKLTQPNGELPNAIAEFRKVGANLSTATGPEGPLRVSLDNVAKLTSEDGNLNSTLENIRSLTGPEGDLAKALKHAEKFTANLENNRDLSLTLQNSRKATESLSTTLNELRFKLSAVADNLEQATDTVKRQPWRLIWPSTKKYDEAPKAAEKKRSENALPATPTPASRKRRSRVD